MKKENREIKQVIAGVLIFGLMVVFGSCGQASKKDRSKQVKEPTSLNALKQTGNGELAYKKNCMACHQRDLGGIPGMYPPLTNNMVVAGDKEALIKIILNGMSGEIEVNGVRYNGVMASYRNLPDEEIAALLTYIRSGFDNEAEAITAAEVKALR